MDKESRGGSSSSTEEIKFVREAGTRVSVRSPGGTKTGLIDYDRSKLTPLRIISSEEKVFMPICIAATPSDDIAVAFSSRNVKMYDINGIPKGSLGIKDTCAISATQDRLVVIKKSSRYVKMYKMDGELDFKFLTKVKKDGKKKHDKGKAAAGQVKARPISVAVKMDGTIVVGDCGKRVTVHNPEDGEIINTIRVEIKPEYLAVDDSNKIIISDCHTILVLDDSNSANTFTFQPTIDGRQVKSFGLCCNKSAIFVVVSDDVAGGLIHKYDNRGKFVECLVKGLLLPKGITITGDKRYLAVTEAIRVAIFNAGDGSATTGITDISEVSQTTTKTSQDTDAQSSQESIHLQLDSDEDHMLMENLTETGYGSATTGITALIEVSETTTKTSQDTDAQSSQESIHLQLVLDEVDKLTKNLSASERLDRKIQLPYIAVGYFNEKGGSLSLDEYGVHLTIPRGAIAPGSPQQVYIYVDPTAPPNGAVEPTEVALSASVKCGPEGSSFNESVVLSFPHCADFIGYKMDKLDIRIHHKDPQRRKSENAKPAIVTNGIVYVLFDHFTGASMVGTPNPEGSKRLKVGAFGSLLDRRTRQYAFRVHVWIDEKDVIEEVIQEEERMKSQMLDVTQDLRFFWGSGNLAVKLTNIESGWTIRGEDQEIIHEDAIRDNPKNAVTLNLIRPAGTSDGEGLYCVARAFQCRPTTSTDPNTRIEARLKITPEKKLSLGELIVDFLSKQFRRGREQRSVSRTTEVSNRCVCDRREERGAVCDYCKKQLKRQFSDVVHGEVLAHEYGGLSPEAVHSLCEHLDDGNKWLKLLEGMSDSPGTLGRSAVESGNLSTKDILKIFFENRRRNNNIDKEAINLLVELLKKLKLGNAAEIVQKDVDKRVRGEQVGN